MSEANWQSWKRRWLAVSPAAGKWFDRSGPNLILGLLVIAAATAALVVEPTVAPEPSGCTPTAAPPDIKSASVGVADATGEQRIDIVIPTSGKKRYGRSAALTIQESSTLPAGTPLAMATTQFRRDDGDVLPDDQVTSVAHVGRDGQTMTVTVCVAPRWGEVSGSGKYVGATSLDDPRARGANVPVEIHITYPYVNRVLLWALLAALAGLIWTWLIRETDKRVSTPQEPWTLTLGVQIASLLVAVPVVISLVIDNHDWTGKLSSYVALAVAVGGAVIAAAPTFRALFGQVGKGSGETGI